MRAQNHLALIGRAVALPRRALEGFLGLLLESRKPPQLLVFGLLSYVIIGVVLLSLPWAQSKHVGLLDNLFTATSGMSTTGLTTVSVSDSYTFFGELVVLCLFQLGGIGYMTLSSFVMLASGQTLQRRRTGVLQTQFVLPREMHIGRFVSEVIIFTAIVEVVGAALLYLEFRAAGVENAVWSAVFHSVSAFTTAGFSLNNDSLESFRGDGLVCVTIGVLCYLGALGFIVMQDAWQTWRGHRQRMTFTSRVILIVTFAIFVVATPILYFEDSSLAGLPPLERFYAAAFQVMTASTTAGFNSVPIHGMAAASFALIIIMMIIGASPSGTGGGLKTTTLSALIGVLLSMLRGRPVVQFYGHEIPMARILTATASAAMYFICLAVGVFLLCLIESHSFVEIVFEAASALGTVGLSLGITGGLTEWGKIVITLLMFVGRAGPLTIGVALVRRAEHPAVRRIADLAV
jgi:trk system potassium uptake protein TrkH